MIRFIVAAMVALAAAPVSAETDQTPPACAPLVGTFLMTKSDTSGRSVGITGRVLLSLNSNGEALMSDSAQGGSPNYQAFGVEHGNWTCEANADGTLKLEATMVDFTYPSTQFPKAQIGRVEVTATLAADKTELKGRTSVNLYDLMDDPFSGAPPKQTVSYTFKGKKVLSGSTKRP